MKYLEFKSNSKNENYEVIHKISGDVLGYILWEWTLDEYIFECAFNSNSFLVSLHVDEIAEFINSKMKERGKWPKENI